MLIVSPHFAEYQRSTLCIVAIFDPTMERTRHVGMSVTLVTNISSPTVTLNPFWYSDVMRALKYLKDPSWGWGGVIPIHWWPHKGPVIQKAFPCHYVVMIPILCPLVWQIGCSSLPDDFFSEKNNFVLQLYLEMRYDGDTRTTLHCFEYCHPDPNPHTEEHVAPMPTSDWEV